MRRRQVLKVTAALIGGSTAAGRVLADDSQLDPGVWYDATVTDVTDGDTIDVVLDADGTEYEIRTLGLDTPETKRNNRYETVEEWEGIEDDNYLADWGERAKDYAQAELPDGTDVQIAVDEDEEEVDPFGRLLAYVRYDKSGDGSFDTLYNRDVIAQGYARVYGSSLTKHDDFWGAERDARDGGVGVWQASDPENTSEVDNDPVDSVYFPNASSVRTSDGAIADGRVPVYAESTATQDLDGGVAYDRIPMVGVDEASNVALVGGLQINEDNDGDDDGQHEVFLTNLVDYLASTSGQVLIDGGHRQFNATYSLSNEDAVYYQRFLEGVGLPFEQVNDLDGTGDNALSTARALFVTSPPEAFTTGEVDAISSFVDGGGAVILVGSALSSGTARSNLNDLASGLGSDLRLNEDQVFDDSNNTGDPAFPTTSAFDTSFPLFDAYSDDAGGGGGSVAVSTDGAADVTDTSATLNGTLSDLGGADAADCYFEYRPTGSDTWSATAAQTLSSTGSYSESVTGLASDTEYEFRAVADASDGDADTGGTLTFTTGAGTGGSAPAIDRFDTFDESNPNWTRYDVDWAVSDADGDLAEVTSELLDSSGTVLDSDSDTVGGADASGTHSVRTRGSASELRLVVVDAAGNATSDAQSI